MRATQVLLDVLRWRWTPTVGLSLGAVLYVVLAVALIPEQIGGSAEPSARTSPLGAPATTSAFSARVGGTLNEDNPVAKGEESAPPPALPRYPDERPSSPPAEPRRGFSPPLERVVPEAQAQPPPGVPTFPPPADTVPPNAPTFPPPVPAPPAAPLPPDIANLPGNPPPPPEPPPVPQPDPNQAPVAGPANHP